MYYKNEQKAGKFSFEPRKKSLKSIPFMLYREQKTAPLFINRKVRNKTVNAFPYIIQVGSENFRCLIELINFNKEVRILFASCPTRGVYVKVVTHSNTRQ